MSTRKKIAIQGTHASFHEEAAVKYFGKDAEILECESFKKTCEILKDKQVDYTVMAIENSLAGSILPNYTLLRDYRFNIVGEVHLSIQLHLMALPDVPFEDIQFIESHPMAIRQCDDFLEENPQIKVSEGMDTAACARKIQEEGLKHTAAIANRMAAEAYGLNILEQRIETNKKNYTRFLILSNRREIVKKANKASLSFQINNTVGALLSVLRCFEEENVNMSKIQSMPVLGRPNEYEFYVDIEWQQPEHYDEAIKKALKHTINFNIMGEYLKNEKVK